MKNLKLFETDKDYVLKTIKSDDLQDDFIDLGLPSGKKWASCNLGATKPCDYGDYYMWGSTTPNTNDVCDWANAPFNNGSSDYDATYFASVSGDYLTSEYILKPEYDAVYQATNGTMRMSTKADYDELLANTTNEWVEDYENSGVNGRLFTSKTDNTKKIFIPASGCRLGSAFYDRDSDVGLWSSSLRASDPYGSWTLRFISGGIDVGNYYRYSGFCVRGVRQ